MRWLLIALLLFAAPVAADESDDAAGFALWLNNYRTGALARGLKQSWLDISLVDVAFLPRVLALDRAQPGDSGKPSLLADYLGRQISPGRINDGLARATANRAAILAAGSKTGVAPEIIMAIWGLESSYGRVTGTFDLPSALATLAYDGRRAALFTSELDAAVRMIGENRVRRDQMKGSWAGAFGQPQFLPSSYLANGADGDGDGRVDIWNSAPDTFMSIGRYLANAHWTRDLIWGFQVGVPPGFDRSQISNAKPAARCARPLARHSYALPVRQWRAWGFQPLNGNWPGDDEVMALVETDGPGGDAFLTTSNYRAVMDYNCSNFYALSVALLGNALAPALR